MENGTKTYVYGGEEARLRVRKNAGGGFDMHLEKLGGPDATE